MKTKLFLLIWLQVSVALVQAQGYIVPNGIVFNFGGLFSPQELDVIHNPANPSSGGSYTGFELNPIGKTQPTVYTNTFSFNPVLDVGVRVFLVSSNTAISLQPILSQSFTELGFAPNYVFNNGVPFYLALYTGNQNNYPPNGIYTDPLFGWVELVNNQGVIQMLGGAIEYGGVGIVAGTQIVIQAVPEPNAWSLLGLSALLVGGWHWKNRGAA
jgi:hypothetical protein